MASHGASAKHDSFDKPAFSRSAPGTVRAKARTPREAGVDDGARRACDVREEKIMRAMVHAVGVVLSAACIVGCYVEAGDDAEIEDVDSIEEGVTTLNPHKCFFDEHHWAEVRLHVTPKKIVGYSIRYRDSGGSWNYGTKNNEIAMRPKPNDPGWPETIYKSIDKAEPGSWINRDAMPNIARGVDWLDIHATADVSKYPDFMCGLRFEDRGTRAYQSFNNP